MLNHQNSLNQQQKSFSWQARFCNASLSNCQANSTRHIKNLNDLFNVIKTKNGKISQELLVKKIRRQQNILLTHSNEESIQAFVDTQIAKNQSIPYDQRNQLEDFSHLKFEDPTSLHLFKANQNLKDEAIKTKIFSDLYKKDKYQIKFLNPSLGIHEKDTPKEMADQESLKRQMSVKKPIKVMSKTKMASQKMQLKIAGYIQDHLTREELNEELEKISLQMKMKDCARIFVMFYNLLASKISLVANKKKVQDNKIPNSLLVTGNNLTIFDYFHQVKMQDHYDIHLRVAHKLESEIKFRTIYARKAKPYEDREIQVAQNLFCKCFLLFLGGEKAKSQLVLILEQNGQTYFVDEIESFFKGNEPEQRRQKLDIQLYSSCLFYRMFVKVIYASDFTQEENSVFKGSQKRIFLYLQLKYRKEFYKTMFYKKEKDLMYDELRQMMQQSDKSGVERVLSKMIEMGEFDNIYFKLFAQIQQSNQKPLHNLILLDIILFHQNISLNTIYSQKQWAEEIMNQIFRLISTVKNKDSYWICRLIVKLLKKSQTILGNETIKKITTELIRSNYLLINHTESAQLIEKNFHITWEFMQKTLLKSFFQFDDLSLPIKLHLRHYICILDQQDSLKTNQSLKLSKFIRNQRQNIHNEDIKLSQSLENMVKQCSDDQIYKNRFFLLGLKLFCKNFFNFYTNSQKPSRVQATKYFLCFQDTLNKAQRLVNKISTMKGDLSLNQQSNQRVSTDIIKNDQELEQFISKVRQILELCEFLGFLYKIERNFQQEQNTQILVKTSRDFEEFLSKKGDSKKFLSRINESFNWLFMEDMNQGYKVLLERFDVLLSILDLRHDWKSRKATPEKMMMRYAKDFLEAFLTNCIEVIRQLAMRHYKNSLK